MTQRIRRELETRNVNEPAIVAVLSAYARVQRAKSRQARVDVLAAFSAELARSLDLEPLTHCSQ